MGGIDFYTSSWGKTLKEAYDNAVNDAIDEYGNYSYNGTISTTSDVYDVTNEFMKSGMEMREFINKKLQRADKRDCYAICIQKPVGNDNKIKSVVENIPTKGTTKWTLVYCVYSWDDRQISRHTTKTEAIKAARSYAEKTQETVHIKMEKRVLNSDQKVAVIKYKKATNEKDGQWKFFGIAAS